MCHNDSKEIRIDRTQYEQIQRIVEHSLRFESVDEYIHFVLTVLLSGKTAAAVLNKPEAGKQAS